MELGHDRIDEAGDHVEGLGGGMEGQLRQGILAMDSGASLGSLSRELDCLELSGLYTHVVGEGDEDGRVAWNTEGL